MWYWGSSQDVRPLEVHVQEKVTVTVPRSAKERPRARAAAFVRERATVRELSAVKARDHATESVPVSGQEYVRVPAATKMGGLAREKGHAMARLNAPVLAFVMVEAYVNRQVHRLAHVKVGEHAKVRANAMAMAPVKVSAAAGLSEQNIRPG